MSCSIALFQGYSSDHQNTPLEPESWFHSDSSQYLFNTKVDLMKDHFSGLMVIKAMGMDSYRIVMITEVGLKILDMEFFPAEKTKVHYVMGALDKRILIKTLSNDISLVLMNIPAGEHSVILKDKISGDRVYKYRQEGRRNYYHIAGDSLYPHWAKQTRGMVNKVRVEYFGRADTGLDSIKLSHYNLALNINFYRIIQ